MGVFVSSTGFQKRTLADIKASMITGFQALFGTETDTSDDGPTGQIIGLISKALANQWDGAQEVYNSYDPSAATGAALDRVCALTGIYRIAAAASHGVAQLYATSDNLGAVIPSGRQARRVRGSVVFSLSADTTIAAASCQDIYLKLSSSPNAGDTVSITTTFGSFSAVTPTALDAATRTSEVIKLLVELISASTWANASNGAVSGVAQLVSSGVVMYPLADSVGGTQEPDSDFFLRIVHPTTAFGVSGYSGWTVGRCGSPGTFVCALDGPYDLEAHELSEIVTPETGWESVGNLVAAVTGRNVETDEELRIRRAASFGTGYATDTSIKNYLYNHVDGIVSASVVSNRTLETDSAGRPPKSFECTVQGGSDADIAKAIWTSMPAGIMPYGYTSETVIDSQGNTQTVKFTRPIEQDIFARITYSLYAEEAFPSDGELLIRDAIISWAASEFSVGKDVFAGRFLGTIYSTVGGLGLVTVEVSADGTTWGSSASIDGRHYAYLQSANLTVQKAA